MIKVAIITHYYKSINYGGNLQSYALAFFLNNNGCCAKQICYSVEKDVSKHSLKHKIIKKFKESPLKFMRLVFLRMLRLLVTPLFYRRVKIINCYKSNRAEAFKHFQVDLIPHTKKEYFDDTLYKLNNEFDFFITGSDQVFNLSMFKEGYFLNFVKDKPKISYAASMALDSIPKTKIQFMHDTLDKYTDIGVREEKTIELLGQVTDKTVKLNLDPVFLLNETNWDNISSKKLVNEKYIFCYFLGTNVAGRRFAKEIAKRNSLKIVCIPCVIKKYRYIDEDYGDYNLFSSSPEDFISLIKYADYVITDSFHACAFSIIYHKHFIVVNRDSKGTMSSRITSLVSVFGCEERFYNDKEIDFEKMDQVLSGSVDYCYKKYNSLKEKSIRFLLGNIQNN